MNRLLRIVYLAIFSLQLFGQDYDILAAEPITLPILMDSNNSSFWVDGRLHVYHSWAAPKVGIFDTNMNLIRTEAIAVDSQEHFPLWIESIWRADEELVYAWYHHEPQGLCPNSKLTAPEIGALVSNDGGMSFRDLGIVLSSGDAIDCNSENGFFAGGHGDFSVAFDPRDGFFYFLFGSYGGDLAGQGVAIARMPASKIAAPRGSVRKYFQGAWNEPGLGGAVTPIFPAAAAWQAPDTDAFWGPSVHWNTALGKYVVVMNRSCCSPMWPQEGVYLTMNSELANPAGWSAPEKILDGGDWYPWILGLGEGETTSVAGSRVT